MLPMLRRGVPIIAILATGCGGATFRWQPSLTSQVPDSTPARFAAAPGESRITGRALDWQRGTPRLVTSRGDTVVVPDRALIEVRLKDKTNHAVLGGVLGLLVGFAAAAVSCDSSSCSEYAQVPYMAGGLGALIGAAFRADHWVRVRPDSK